MIAYDFFFESYDDFDSYESLLGYIWSISIWSELERIYPQQ